MTHCINGQWIAGGGESFSKADPVDGAPLWGGRR